MSVSKFHSPPAWSMGSARKGSDWKGNSGAPGPGSYNFAGTVKYSPPSWRMGTASRSVELKRDVPGPGAYELRNKNAGPQYHFGLKNHTDRLDTNPGPGSYNVDKSGVIATEHRAPSYSMRPKTASNDDRGRNPGPGAYNQTSRILNQSSPNIKIGTATRDGLYSGDKSAPGPGAYNLRPSSAAPKYGFGTASRDGLADMSKTLPGPGSYTFKGSFERAGAGTSMVPRRPQSAGMGSPGPGAYNPKSYDKVNAPTARIGTASRDGFGNRSGSPGPGAYNPSGATKSRAPTHVMGTSTRRPLSANNATPGPGSYQFRGGSDAPKYSMTSRKDLRTDQAVPGPGAYTPNVNQAKERSAAVGIGTSQRHGLYNTQQGPGPGYYKLNGTLSGPKWGFGSENRDKGRNEANPGPGAYNIPTMIADVPKYVFGGSPLKIHL